MKIEQFPWILLLSMKCFEKLPEIDPIFGVLQYITVSHHCITPRYRERSGSVVGCLTQDRVAAGSSLTGVTALCP